MVRRRPPALDAAAPRRLRGGRSAARARRRLLRARRTLGAAPGDVARAPATRPCCSTSPRRPACRSASRTSRWRSGRPTCATRGHSWTPCSSRWTATSSSISTTSIARRRTSRPTDPRTLPATYPRVRARAASFRRIVVGAGRRARAPGHARRRGARGGIRDPAVSARSLPQRGGRDPRAARRNAHGRGGAIRLRSGFPARPRAHGRFADRVLPRRAEAE